MMSAELRGTSSLGRVGNRAESGFVLPSAKRRPPSSSKFFYLPPRSSMLSARSGSQWVAPRRPSSFAGSSGERRGRPSTHALGWKSMRLRFDPSWTRTFSAGDRGNEQTSPGSAATPSRVRPGATLDTMRPCRKGPQSRVSILWTMFRCGAAWQRGPRAQRAPSSSLSSLGASVRLCRPSVPG